MDAVVRGSNAVEGIYVQPGATGYDDHYAAAAWVRQHPHRAVASPRMIHGMIMAHTAAQPGEFRHPDARYSGGVTVGGRQPMRWDRVPGAMRILTARARMLTRAGLTANDIPYAETLWDMHYEYEWIHPHLDGNGRTGRLWLNALRQCAGYPWVIVDVTGAAGTIERQAYYRAIKDWIARHQP